MIGTAGAIEYASAAWAAADSRRRGRSRWRQRHRGQRISRHTTSICAASPCHTIPAPNKEAIKMLEWAVGIDSSYAPAWEALGLRYYFDSLYGGGGEEMFQRSNAAYERAVSLDPNRVMAASNSDYEPRGARRTGTRLRCRDRSGAAASAERRRSFRAQLRAALCRHARANRCRNATRRGRSIREILRSVRAPGRSWRWARRIAPWISCTSMPARSGRRG